MVAAHKSYRAAVLYSGYTLVLKSVHVPIDTKDFIVPSFRPITFVRNRSEGINRFGSLSGEISQHQR